MFNFGKNWKRYLPVPNQEDRLEVAIQSIKDFMGVEDLKGKTFIDVGCGSGFFSYAAWKMGATVWSLDVNPECIQCTQIITIKLVNLIIGKFKYLILLILKVV